MTWDKDTIWYIMTVVVILHNMFTENEQWVRKNLTMIKIVMEEYQRHDPFLLSEFLRMHNEIEDRTMLERLCDDLVEHFWIGTT